MGRELFTARLNKAMAIRNMRQVDLVEKAKIPKGSINQYVSGYANNPTTERIYQLAKALSVDPVWLMGFDVPMEITKTSADNISEELKNNPKVIEVVERFTKLSETNQDLVLNLVRSLQ